MKKHYHAKMSEYLVPVMGYFSYIQRMTAHLASLEEGSQEYLRVQDKASKRISGIIITNTLIGSLAAGLALSGLEKILL